MTGAELYAMIDVAAVPGDPDAAEKRKAAIIEVLQDALDATWESGRDAEEEKWLNSGAVC